MPAQITAAMVNDLRDKTDMPMMQCKRALVACNGDMEKAADWLRHPPQPEQSIAHLEARVTTLEKQVRDLIERTRIPISTYGE